ncbi:vWA domain-containing protein [Nocardia niwae]|uniref:vWA domain-containing protein n=1 Tax=Nocardia niwae TaxID=626084 RepID=UPI003408515F
MNSRTVTTIAQLARKAGHWLGLTDPPPRHVHAVVGDRYDEDAWKQTLREAASLTDLQAELTARLPHADDLLRDMFVLAIKHSPTIREVDEMVASRLPNRAIIESLSATPEFEELHRHTIGDRYAAAMAVLAQAPTIRAMLDNADNADDAHRLAEEAQQREQSARGAAVAVADAFAQADAAVDGQQAVPDHHLQAVTQAVEAADNAQQAAEAAAVHARDAAAALASSARAGLREAMTEAAAQAQAEKVLMDAWQLSSAQLQRMSFTERSDLARRLRSGRLGEYAELIGRFRMVAHAEHAQRSDHGHDELAGITRGDDLSRLLPSELIALAVPALRAQFAARYAEADLTMYEVTGEERQGLGAIIAVVDCSSSMNRPHRDSRGRTVTREAWAKACALALLDQARRQRRDFVAILFSDATDIDTFRFPAAEPPPLDRVLAMADCFHANGTDFQAPLGAAAEIIAEHYNRQHTPRGDIVLITDGEATVEDTWLTDWKNRKATLGFRVFGISIKAAPGATLRTLCDDLRVIDELTPATTADLFRTI